MTQAKVKFASFKEYLIWSDDPENYMEGRYELIDGELVQLPPESPENNFIANNLQFLLVTARAAILRLIRIHSLELQVPVLQPKDAANRYPDLVVLRPEHIALMGRRLTITLDMPPPILIAEVVSPGKSNRDRDYINKRSQYAAIGVPEYWLVDPKAKTVTVLELEGDDYREIGTFQGITPIVSPTFPALTLSAEQVFQS
jgi:Uma2 family endonuclease